VKEFGGENVEKMWLRFYMGGLDLRLNWWLGVL
jgi:hypothetical protein